MDQMGEAALQQIENMKHDAIIFIQRYAMRRAPDVGIDFIAAICDALGDISVDEAVAALDKAQRDLIISQSLK